MIDGKTYTMPGVIRFTVPAVPVAQPRQRQRIVNANGKTFASNYTPKNAPVNGFKASVQHAAAEVYRGAPLNVPLRMVLVFVMPRPKTMTWKNKPMPREPYAAMKNDWDNLGKSVCDALNKLLFVDDGLLVDVRVERWIAAGDEQPHVQVEVTQA